jgi:UDP-galactopyranose mutase|tara:strand:+ start:8576 stop:9589 length:1014 start_codon:yes stop_codon:yes gene_type:complete
MNNILVVGAGLSGAVIARELAEFGCNVHVIDKRDHVAGNAYDYQDSYTGIRIHKYGPHIFHTNNKKAFTWFTRFGEWVNYKHKVKAKLKNGQMVTLPVNLTTKRIVGENNLLDVLFRPYTKKMWNKEIEELSPTILNRLPTRDDDNEYYFPNDQYQFMPKSGYTSIFKEIFDHKNIKVSLNTPFHKHMKKDYDHIFNSMSIDEYFDYRYGKLPYRSIKFLTSTLGETQYYGLPVVNFTDMGPFTRVTEWKCFPSHGENKNCTVVTFEEPCDYMDNNLERYYPVKDIDGSNRRTYQSYKLLVEDNMTFIGRCGMYVYIDMDQAIHSSLITAQKFKDTI